MKIVYNHIIPIGCKCMCVYPFIFTRSKRLSDTDIRHETIHGEQQLELLILPFFLLYIAFYIINVILCVFDKKRGYSEKHRNNGVFKRAYLSIAFEQEAYENEKDATYLDNRKCYAWVKYLF